MNLVFAFDWVLVAAAAVATRLIPFFIYGVHPLGYDTGFYRHYAAQESTSILHTASAGLGTSSLLPRLVLDVIRSLGISPDMAIYGTLIGAFACAALSLQYTVKKRLGTKAGLFTGLLFIFSSVQYAGYWFFLLKNYIALSFFFLVFNGLEKSLSEKPSTKNVFFTTAGAAILFFSHTTTSLVLIMTIGVFSGILFLKRRIGKSVIIPIVILAGLSVIFFFQAGIWQKIDWQTKAIFLDWKEYAQLTTPLLLLLPFIGARIKNATTNPFFSLLTVALIFTLFKLPFYERMFLFLDIALIVFCAEGLISLKNEFPNGTTWKKTQILLLTGIFVGWYTGSFFLTVKKYIPLITPAEIGEIRKIDALTEKNATILTVSDSMPWVYGFASRKTISPGLLERTYNLEKWKEFWFEMNEAEKADFLKAFPSPLYFFIKPGTKEFLTGRCAEKKTDYLYKFICR